MISSLPHVSRTMDVVRAGLHDLMAKMLRGGGVSLPVRGTVDDSRALVLLPYQIALESTPTIPTAVLVPATETPAKDAIPPAWRHAGNLVTRIVTETFPVREAKGPGLGPIAPAPRLADLPAPLADWYRHRAPEDFRVDAAEPRGRLPLIAWRHPFPLAFRMAALVTPGPNPSDDADALQLRALALVAAGVRLGRHFVVHEPPYVEDGPLLDLLRAFAKVDHPAAAELAEVVDVLAAPRELAVGLTVHNELSDQDLSLLLQTLRQPMQPAVVFSVRVALGAGPELSPGALPHLAHVEGARR